MDAPPEQWYNTQDEEIADALTVMEALGGDWYGPFGFISFDDQMTW